MYQRCKICCKSRAMSITRGVITVVKPSKTFYDNSSEDWNIQNFDEGMQNIIITFY